MRLALFHNLPSGGAKRHTYEQVRELTRRGHEVVEFAPSSAELAYCSLAPYVSQQRIFDVAPGSQLQSRIPLLTPYVHAVQGIKILRRTERLNQQVAKEIDQGNFDLVFVKDCQITMNPYILRYLTSPAVFQCHHGVRHRLERAGAIRFRKGLTNRDYLRAARPHPGFRSGLNVIVGHFEETHFGRRAATPERFEACLDRFRRSMSDARTE